MLHKRKIKNTKPSIVVSTDTKLKKILASKLSLILIIAGLVIFSYASYSIFRRYTSTYGTATLPPVASVVTSSTKEPDEKMPDMSAPYDVAEDMPRRLIMDSTSVNGFIQQVGIDEQNAISVPSNVHLAGWYVNSKKPGDEGLSIVDGHVSGKYNDGIFKKLSQAKVGTVFSVEFGDLSVRRFEVVEVKQLPESQSADFLLKHDESIKAQLNLITCGGKFNKVADTFDDRIIVVAKRVKD